MLLGQHPESALTTYIQRKQSTQPGDSPVLVCRFPALRLHDFTDKEFVFFKGIAPENYQPCLDENNEVVAIILPGMAGRVA